MKKIMKYLLSLILLISSSTVAVTHAENEKFLTWDQIKERGYLLVATEGTYAPVTYVNEEGTLTGFDVELMRKIGEYLEIEVEFVPTVADALLPAIRNGQADLVANNVTITEDRLEQFEMSVPYKYSYSTVIIKKENKDKYKDALDLTNGRFAVGSLTGTYAQFAEAVGAQPILYDAGTDAILMDVMRGQVDGYLNERLVALQTVKEYDNDDLIVDLKVKYDPISAGFPAAKGNTSLIEKIDEAIEALLKDGTIKQLSIEFYGEDATEKPGEDEKIITKDDIK